MFSQANQCLSDSGTKVPTKRVLICRRKCLFPAPEVFVSRIIDRLITQQRKRHGEKCEKYESKCSGVFIKHL